MKKLISVIIMALMLAVPAGVVMAEEDSVCMEQVSQGMEVRNPSIQLSHLTGITPEGAYVRIFSGISVADVVNLWNDIIYLKDNTEIEDVFMFINSPGGSAFAGLALSDWIKHAQNEWGFNFHAYASGIIASAAVPIFAVCEVREAMPGTIFMVHEAALWKWPGRETASDIRAQNELMTILRDKYIGILVDHSTTSKEEWEAMERKTSWFSAEKARELGLLNE